MRAEHKMTKRGWAAVAAVVLAGAIALTGTFAWQNRSQEQANELLEDKNYGGRFHDDFNGLENKDIYAENFNSTADGSPVFVRVRLEEYMETGPDAGINRNPAGGAARQVTPALAGADINDTTTWHVHKPGESAADDPFHEFYTWSTGGSTTYMPTFNKNKDSISVDVNGTYAGTDKDFETGVPYDDYDPVNPGDTETADAYYDADPNSVDEYNPTATPPEVPGGGGVEVTPTNPTGNYTKTSETHNAQSTLNGLGVITMTDWLAAGQPVCNKWVWDEDGWYYWPEPVLPETATGLLLNKIQEIKAPTDRTYYAINLVGQFASAFDWGDPNTATAPAASNATGFYIDGFTDNAKILLDQAANVDFGEDGRWYLPVGGNVYKEIRDDLGTLGSPICAGQDEFIGNLDDRTDVVYVEGGVTIGSKNYGEYFLKPTTSEPYYRATTPDDLLGHETDDRLWVLSGSFPDDAVDRVASSIEITPAAGATVVGGKVEVETRGSVDFDAAVKLDANPAANQDVLWSVAASDGTPLAAGTTIDANGTLTIAADETAAELVVTAKSRLDDRVSATYDVKVIVLSIRFAIDNGATVSDIMVPGETLGLKALLYRNDDEATTQPTDFTWEVGTSTDDGATITSLAGVTINSGYVTVAGTGAYTGGDNVDIYVKAVSASSGVSGVKRVTIKFPDRMELTGWESATTLLKHQPLNMVVKMFVGTDSHVVHAGGFTWKITTPSDTVTSDAEMTTLGILNASSSAVAGDQVKVTVTSLAFPSLSASTTLTVADHIEIDGRKITVDGVPLIIMTTQGDKTLVLSEMVIDNSEFGNKWVASACTVRNYLISWLDSKPNLKAHAKGTRTYIRKDYNASDFDYIADNIFLLSEADVFDTHAKNTNTLEQDYTAGAVFKWKSGGNWIAYDNSGNPSIWWTRTPDVGALVVTVTESNQRGCANGSHGVRPALWLDKAYVESLLGTTLP